MNSTHAPVPERHIKRHAELLSYIQHTLTPRGKYWTEAAKTFDVELRADGYLSKGERNYLPEVFHSKNTLPNEMPFWDCLQKRVSKRAGRFAIKKIKIHEDRIEVNSKNFQPFDLWCEQLYYFDRIKAEVPNFHPKKVLEVGGGSGLMAAVLSAELNAKVFILDLPEMLAVSSAFLLYTFPEKKILLPHEVNEKTNFDEFDFVLLTTEQRNLLPKGSFDFVLNIASFQEMDLQEVNSYFDLFQHCLAKEGYFFCSNRIRKMTNFFEYPWKKLQGFEEVFTERGKFRQVGMLGQSTFIDRLMVRTENVRGAPKFSDFKNELRDFLLQFALHAPERKYWLMHDLRASRPYGLLRSLKNKLKSKS